MIAATRRRDRRAAVGQLLSEPGPPGEDVVERERELVADGPGDLGLEEGAARDERPEQVELGARARPRPGASVPWRATSRAAASGPTAATAGIVASSAGDPGQRVRDRRRRRGASSAVGARSRLRPRRARGPRRSTSRAMTR